MRANSVRQNTYRRAHWAPPKITVNKAGQLWENSAKKKGNLAD